jgi:FkbH-like protein
MNAVVIDLGILRSKLLGTRWIFGSRRGRILTNTFRFGESGLVEDYEHDNEVSWKLDGHMLEIYRANGELMWTSARVSTEDNQMTIVLTTPKDPQTEFFLKEYSVTNLSASAASDPSPLRPADFLFPKDLQVTPVKIERVLLIGSCLTALYHEQFSILVKEVKFDYLTYNFAGSLPAAPPAPVETYQFQYVQIPLRSVLSDRIVWGTQFNDPGFAERIYNDGCNVIDIMLDSALTYNKAHGILSFVSNFFVPQMAGVTSLDARYSPLDISQITRRLNDHLAASVRKYKNVYLADVNAVGDSIGKQYILDDMIYFYSHNAVLFKEWADLGNIPRIEPIPPIETFYASKRNELIAAVYDQAIALYRTIHQVDQVKAVVFDLDNTLWRGQLAEHYRPNETEWPKTDGWPLGIWEAIHHLRARGILVAICSKNDQKMVEAYWDNVVQPKFLSLKDFVAIKINWLPKSENIKEICKDFNIKPKSVVFVDDNPVERAAVKAALPDIRVIGANPYLTRRILLWAPETQVAHLTNESSRREDMIRSQITREDERKTLSREEFLATLQCKISFVEIRNAVQAEFPRMLELTNKTNQFNTTGKRWAHAEVMAFLAQGGRIFSFFVADKFSEYGLVGVLFIERAKILQFVMSCRVLGMEIEVYAVAYVVEQMRASHLTEDVTAKLIVTPDNTPCRDVFTRSGFRIELQDSSHTVFTLRRGEQNVLPGHIAREVVGCG